VGIKKRFELKAKEKDKEESQIAIWKFLLSHKMKLHMKAFDPNLIYWSEIP
jgi:hypothetical protein